MEFDFTQGYESEDKVPEQFRPLFKKADDGAFKLDADNPTIKTAASAITGLNNALKAARGEVKGLKGSRVDLTPLTEFGATPAEIRAAIDAKLEEAAKAGKGVNVEKLKEQWAAENGKTLGSLREREKALVGQMSAMLIDSAAITAITELKGIPDLLLPVIKAQVKVVEEDGKFVARVLDSQGDLRYGPNGAPMSIRELVALMKADEKYARVFESDRQGGGGGTPPGSTRNNPNGAGAQRQGSDMSSADKIKAGLVRRGFGAR